MTYNAVTWLLDRNVDEGRGTKLAFTDTVSELTYGDLQKQSRRVANLLRRLGVRREERVAMIMLDTVDFPAVFLGAIRAGIVPVPLNTLLTSDQYAYVLADCRDRKSTRLNSSHTVISYAVFCLKKKKKLIMAFLFHKKKNIIPE